MKTASKQIVAIQVIRAFAAICVVMGHSIEEYGNRFHCSVDAYMKYSWLNGVDLFFVISGFIMIVTNWDNFSKPKSPFAFIKNRIVRVVPAYYFFTLLVIIIGIFVPATLGMTTIDVKQVICSFLFFPCLRPKDHLFEPILSVGWTLNYEMFFYALFTFALLWKRKYGVPALVFFLLLLAALNPYIPISMPALTFWTRPVIVEFAFGIIVGSLYRQGCIPQLRSGVSLCLWLLTIVVFFMGKSVISVNAPRWISDGIPAAFVVFGALTIPDKTQKRIPSLFSAIGDASYSTYLSHRFGLRIATFVFVVLQGMLGLVNLWLFVALISIVSLGVGQLSYEYLERPVLVYIRSGKK